MRTRILLAVGLFGFSGLAATAQTVDQWIIAGRTYLTQKDIANANASFAAAVKAAPNNETANVFYAATRVLALPSQPPVQRFLDRLGVPATNRSIYHWTARLPADTNGVPLAPAGMSASEVTALLRTNMLPEIAAAAANLAVVVHTNFLLTISSNETTLGEVTLDYGDVLLARALLHAAEYYGYTIDSWNLDAQLSELRELATNEEATVEQLLARHPQLLAFSPTANLAAAKQAFTNAIGLYLQASAFIRARPDGQTRLFNYDPDMFDKEREFRWLLTDLRDSLEGPVTLRTAPTYALNLERQFDGSHSLRSLLPQVAGNQFLANTLPDETFGGLVSGLSAAQVEEFLAKAPGLAPWLEPLGWDADKRFGLSLHSAPGRSFALQASENLSVWTERARLLGTIEGVSLADPPRPGGTLRFYRAAELEGAANDNFANRATVFGSDVTVYGDNSKATREFGEPAHAATGTVNATVWWSWLAPDNGLLTVDPRGSGYWPTVALYAGGMNGPRVETVGFNTFPVTAGQTYSLVAGTLGGSGGEFKLRLRLFQPPANDNFVNRFLIAGAPQHLTGHCVGATSEPGEPQYPWGQSANLRSVWWTWTAPSSGRFRIGSVRGQAEDEFSVAVYTGSALASLTRLSAGQRGRTVADASAGQAYNIAIFTFAETWDSFDFLIEQITPAVNDNFANRTPLAGASTQTVGTIVGAFVEAGEPDQGLQGRYPSVWYTWTAPAAGVATVTLQGDGTPLSLSAYVGDSLAQLALYARDTSTYGVAQTRFFAAAGATYQICVAGWVADFSLALQLTEGVEQFEPPVFAEQLNNWTAYQGPQRSVHDGQGGVYVYFQPLDMAGGAQMGSPIRLREADGSVDPAFSLGPTLAYADAVAVQADGKILIAGALAGAETVIRVDTKGQLDPTFVAPAFSQGLRFITIQRDGRILLAIADNQYNNPLAIQVPTATLYRLNANGRLDTTFKSPALAYSNGTPFLFAPPTLDDQGRIYIGGSFDAVNGTNRVNFARLLANGDLDAGYAATASIAEGLSSSQVRGIGLQSDGKAVIVGDFRIPGSSPTRLGALRFDVSGNIDRTFGQVAIGAMLPGPGTRPRALIMLPDDKFLVVSGSLARLNADGSVDSTFSRPVFGAEAYWLSRMSDGRLVVPGVLSVNGTPVGGVAAFSANGTFDATFQAPGFGVVNYPLAQAMLADGRLAVAGQFNHAGQAAQMGLAILESDGSLAPSQMPVSKEFPWAVDVPWAALAPGPERTFYYLLHLSDTNGKTTPVLGRAHADGRSDNNFRPGWLSTDDLNSVSQLYSQADGKLILSAGGSAQAAVNGHFSARLLLDGSMDNSFVDPSGSLQAPLGTVTRDPDQSLATIAVGDLRIVRTTAAGKFLAVVNGIDGTTSLVRLSANGAVEWQTVGVSGLGFTEDYPTVYDWLTGTRVQVYAQRYAQRAVADALELSDGHILVCGAFATFGGVAAPGLVRLNADGSVDTSFSLASGPVWLANPLVTPCVDALAKDVSGQVYIAGVFDSFNGTPAPGLARLKLDGTVDTSFTPSIRYVDYPGGTVSLQTAGGPSAATFNLEYVGGQLYVFGTFTDTAGAFPRALWRLDIGQ